ncbi:hypothetical protein Aperf_G00000044594 [Anoplocephala perfoliata]
MFPPVLSSQQIATALAEVSSKTLSKLINIGDQRGDRRKWIYLFETIHAVLFFASLVDFVEKSQFPEFEVAIIVLFNSSTLNLDKTRRELGDILSALLSGDKWSAPSNYPELQESNDPETCISTQRDLFLSRGLDRGQKSGRIFTHTVCLLDIDEMKSKSKAVLKDVLESNFRRHAMF